MKICPTKDSWSYKMLTFVWRIPPCNNVCLYLLSSVITILGIIVLFIVAVSALLTFVWPIYYFLPSSTVLGLEKVFLVSRISPYLHAPILIGGVLGFGGSFFVGGLILLKIVVDIVVKVSGMLSHFSKKHKVSSKINLTNPFKNSKLCQLCKDIDFEKGTFKKD